MGHMPGSWPRQDETIAGLSEPGRAALASLSAVPTTAYSSMRRSRRATDTTGRFRHSLTALAGIWHAVRLSPLDRSR